jgi:hypothetical protein
MFNFLQKTVFEKYYSIFLSHSAIKGKEHSKEVTAAYLYVLSDFALMVRGDHAERQRNAQKIFKILETKFLSSIEMQCFDNIVDLFGKVLRGEISPRGDWCFLDEKSSSGIKNLFWCYGDLIWSPHYIEDYLNAPILIKGVLLQTSFASNFISVMDLTKKYIDSI